MSEVARGVQRMAEVECHPYDEQCGPWGKCRNHDGEVRRVLSEADREALVEAIQGGDEVEWVESLLAARAAAPDALRERVEALAAEWEADDEAYLDRVGHHYAVSLGGMAKMLRAALADPADGATS